MDTAFQPPAFTGFDAVTQGIAGIVYGLVGIAAWLSAPRDTRTRVFLGVSLANVVVVAVPTLGWLNGVRDFDALPRIALVALFCGLAVGVLSFFHFCQVFPGERPWLTHSGVQLPVAYALTPLITGILLALAPSGSNEVSAAFIMTAFVFGFPLLVLLTIILPLAAIVSLVRSHREADGARRPMRVPIAFLLVSQIGAGALAVLFGLLATLSADSTALDGVTAVVWLFEMLTPGAFALAVWKYGLPSANGG